MTVSFLSSVLWSLLLWCSLASGYSETEICTTKFGPTALSPVPSSTATKSTTSTVTVHSTTTPTKTVTPKSSTTRVIVTDVSTITVASTTDTLTDTQTIEVFITSTTTTAFTVFAYSTVTTIEPTPTTTVPTSPGFAYPTPPTTPTAAFRKLARYEPRPHAEREVAKFDKRASSDANAVEQIKLAANHGTLVHSPAQYPTSVICTVTLEYFSTTHIVSTAKPTTTTAKAGTITSTITTISTSTVSIYESFTEIEVTTSITLTEIISVPSTTTDIITETATLIPPQQTLYAACNAQNLIAAPSGYYFAGEAYNPPSIQHSVQLQQNTSYDCCVACITDPACKVAEFFDDPEFSEVSCTLDYGDSSTSCDAETVDVTIGNGGAGYGQSFSGGNCGGNFVFSYQGY
ncbi:hypothetical protein MMC19_002400 [Ptychographa xylographoides]|nr:hypothetical protein [Ptychographa xylographoides]